MAGVFYKVRRMETGDADAVVELSQLFEPMSTTLWRGIDAQEGANWVRERVLLPEWAGFVAQVKNDLIGFALCKDMNDDTRGFVFPHANETVHLLYLAVDEAFRGHGVARCLLNECEKQAREWGRSGILLDITSDNPVLRIYHRFGFEELGSLVFLRKKL
jgi:ribosomal protein S18 acetylase RimI-like enzyme